VRAASHHHHGTMGALRPAGFFVLRTPLLAMDVLLDWTAGSSGAPASDREAWDSRSALLRQGLAELVRRPEVREAIFVASPDLDDAVDVWLDDPLSERGGRAERALVRYVARMCTRPTPFGLFAGCSVGSVGGVTDIRLPGLDSYRRTTRLDMEYVATLVGELERTPELRRRLTYRPNSSLYTAAGRTRYVEAVLRDRVRRHRLVAVDSSGYLLDTLSRAGAGATAAGLAEALVDDDITIEEATGFVEELIDAQLLVSELEPVVTGTEPTAALIDGLRGGGDGTTAAVLGDASARLHALDQQSPGLPPQHYRDIAGLLGGLPARVELPRLFQVDLTKPVDTAQLGPEVVRELEAAAHLLHQLSAPPRNTPLDRFRERFVARYEDAAVPLEQALDEEVGIGFDANLAPAAEASPLLGGLDFPGDAETTVPWSRTMTFLTRRLTQALRDGAQQIRITAEDAEGLAAADLPPLPSAFAVTASLAAASPDAFRTGDFSVLVHGVVGPSGARMLGRFCHSDPELESQVRGHLAREAALQPDAIFAEIVHLPEGRIGNIMHRPVLRDHEIIYLGRSGAPLDQQIPVSDLVVSVRGNRVVLHSQRLGREVIPRLTTAHNFQARSIGTYRFLCALQNQGVHGLLTFDWGMLAASPYLPRVVSGRVVLSRARWRLGRSDIATLDHKQPHARFVAMQALRARLHLPRLAVLSDADNELTVDLDNPLMAETLAHLLRRRTEAVLVELFPSPDCLWISGPEGRFAGEVIVPFEARVPAATPRVALAPAQAQSPAAHIPGSDWLFLKLYCGTSTADGLLRDLVTPLVRDARASGAVDRWFFIRYSDPDWHLRLRFHGAPDALAALLIDVSARIEPLLADASVSRLAVDTYRPELQRYGGVLALPLVESIFEADSDAVLDIIALLSGDEGMDARWRLTLRGSDMLLDDLGLSWDERRKAMRSLRDAYRIEHRVDATLRRQVGERFRRESASLVDLVRRSNDAASDLSPGLDVLAARSARIRPLGEELRALGDAGRLVTPLPDIARSLVHMHANRLLRSAQRAQELVIYDFLDRVYTSIAERP
jgi:lantibiotic biosynthesis protein